MATLGQHIEANLGLLVSSGIAGLLAYAIGTTQTTGTIREMTNRVSVLERRVDASAAYHNCATRHLDMIERGDKANSPCVLEGM